MLINEALKEPAKACDKLEFYVFITKSGTPTCPTTYLLTLSSALTWPLPQENGPHTLQGYGWENGSWI
jgi:hypothetical protein